MLIAFAFRQSFYFGGILLPSQNYRSGGRLGSSLGTDLQISPLSWDQSSNSVWSECITKTSITLILQCETHAMEHRETDGKECSSSIAKAFYRVPSNSIKQLSFLLKFNLQFPIA